MTAPFDSHQNYIGLEVFFEGPSRTLKVNVILDTGACFSLIPWEVAENLGYDPATTRRKHTVTTVSGIETIPLIEVNSIEAMGQKTTGLLVGIHDLPSQAATSGLLGLNFLQRFEHLSIDFRKGLIVLR